MLSIIQIVSCLLFCIIIKSQNTNSSTSASQVNIPEREVIIKGNYFFNQQDGSRFFIKGLVYQHRFEIDVDPLTLDESLCNYYAKLTSDIGANAVLVYSIDAKKDHSQCMNIFKKYKIQVVLGMNTIATRDEKMNSVYGVDDYSSMELIVQEFLKYSNFMGFIAGFESKELLKSEDNYETSLSISKAIIRDTKGIIKEQSKNVKDLKSLPIIGLSVRSDLKQKLDSYTNYFTCPEDNSDTRPDFISFSSLNMCNKLKLPNSVDFDTFPWNSYPVPLFFSEIGCDDSDTRTFDMFNELGKAPIVDHLSGGFVYELKEGSSGTGIVRHIEKDITLFPSYFRLTNTWKSYPPKDSTKLSSYKIETKNTSCDTSIKLQPPNKPNQQVCNCVNLQSPCKSITKGITPKQAYQTVTELCKNRDCSQLNFPTGKYSQCSLDTMVSWIATQSALDGRELMINNEILNCPKGTNRQNITSLPLSFDKCYLWQVTNYSPPPLVLELGMNYDYLISSSAIMGKPNLLGATVMGILILIISNY